MEPASHFENLYDRLTLTFPPRNVYIFLPCKEINLAFGAVSSDYKLWVRSAAYPSFLCPTPDILFQARFLSQKLVSANLCEPCHFYIWAQIYLWLMCNTKPRWLPYLCVYVCIYVGVCAVVLYDCVCLLCMFGGWYSLKRFERGWPVECRG